MSMIIISPHYATICKPKIPEDCNMNPTRTPLFGYPTSSSLQPYTIESPCCQSISCLCGQKIHIYKKQGHIQARVLKIFILLIEYYLKIIKESLKTDIYFQYVSNNFKYEDSNNELEFETEFYLHNILTINAILINFIQ